MNSLCMQAERPEYAALVFCVIVSGCGVQEACEKLGLCRGVTQISKQEPRPCPQHHHRAARGDLSPGDQPWCKCLRRSSGIHCATNHMERWD